MNIILSIRPKYAESILSGRKKYEFRKSIFKRDDIDIIYIYCTYPIKRIVGAFRAGAIIEDRPVRLWEQYKEFSGLGERDFFDYFDNVEKGFAIEIKSLEEFEDPVDPADLMPGFVPPQSIRYINFSLSPGDFWDKGKKAIFKSNALGI